MSPSRPIGVQIAFPIGMHRERAVLHHRSEPPECPGCAPDLRVHLRIGVRLLEAFADHPDPEPFDSAIELFRVGPDLRRVLARVEPVGARDRLEHPGVVGDGRGHRSHVVQGQLDGHHAGIGHEPVGGLESHHPAHRRGNPDRAALVAADGHVHVPARDEHGASRRRAAGRVAASPGVVNGSPGAGVAASRQAEVLAVGLAEDGPARIEDPRHDGRVDLRDVAFEGRGAGHHRHSGHADVVLDRDALARERAVRRAFDGGPDVPGVVGFSSSRGSWPGVRG